METVLVLGSTGMIGVSVVIGALKLKLNVLAVVRNAESAEKMYRHVGTKEGITVFEADVTTKEGLESVIEHVKAGTLPAFQHVYIATGRLAFDTLLDKDFSLEDYRENMRVNVEANYLAYRAMIPYLIDQGNPNSTYTQITGGSGECGVYGVTGMTQGALFTLCRIASRALKDSNVRFNEVYLSARVEYDSMAEERGTIKASVFARHYAGIINNKSIKGIQVRIFGAHEVDELDVRDRVAEAWKELEERHQGRLRSAND